MVVITSIVGFFGTSHCRMATAMGFRFCNFKNHSLALIHHSIPAILLCIAGAIVDGGGYAYIRKLHACANEDLDAYGNNDYQLTAQGCILTNEGHDCACVREKFDANSDTDCYLFDLHEGDNCGHILDLPPDLQASYLLCLVSAFTMLLFSIITCGTVCCPAKCCGFANEEEKNAAMANAGLNEPLCTPHVMSESEVNTVPPLPPSYVFYGKASVSRV